MIAVDLLDVMFLGLIAFCVAGVLSIEQVPSPYDEIGGGDYALDVSDNVSVAPLDSPAGQEELTQLRDAIARLQEHREAEPDSAEANTGGCPAAERGRKRHGWASANSRRAPRLRHPREER